MEKPLMRALESATASAGSAAVLAAPPANMAHEQRQPGELWSYAVYALVAAACIVLGYYQFHAVVLRILAIAEKQHGIRALAYPGLLWLGLGFLLIVVRTIFWILYRPAPAAAREGAPSLTVVIPAYNEGAMVLQSIESAVKADYPHDRLQILVIDDGSKDDTWSYISQAAERYPGVVTALRQDRNRGKREALALGFSHARGEILVTIDCTCAT
jgi:hyaluronan synthase